jgi:hypothetical protein
MSIKIVTGAATAQGLETNAVIHNTVQKSMEEDAGDCPPKILATQLPLHMTNNHNLHKVMKRTHIQLRKLFQKK